MLRTENLTYRIGKKSLLQHVSFEANFEEVLAIVGPNGAGKTTLLKLLSKEILPTTGKIFLNNTNLQQFSGKELAKIRAVLPQHNPVSLPFSVQEVVMMGRYPHFEYQPDKKDIEIVESTLAETDSLALVNRNYQTLSGGEQQRVQLARVLAQIWETENGFLFLDEPTANLDLLHQHQTAALARKFSRKGYCVIMVLHDLNLALQYSDKILLLKNGEIVAFGKTTETLTTLTIEAVFEMKVQMINSPEISFPFIAVSPKISQLSDH